METAPPNAEIHQYRLDPSRFAIVRRQMIVRMAVVAPLLLVAVWYFDARLDKNRDFFDFVGMPVIVLIVAYQSIKREHKKWDSLTLEFRSDRLIRAIPGFPSIEIESKDTSEITETRRGITLRSKPTRKALSVSRHLLNYDEFRNRLSVWASLPISESRGTTIRAAFFDLFEVSLCVLAFGLPLYLFYTPHRQLILPFGILGSLAMAGVIWYSYKSPELPIAYRWRFWFLLLLPVGTTISRLAGVW